MSGFQARVGYGLAHKEVKISRSYSAGSSTHEQWVLGDGAYLYFENDVLTSWQETTTR